MPSYHMHTSKREFLEFACPLITVWHIISLQLAKWVVNPIAVITREAVVNKLLTKPFLFVTSACQQVSKQERRSTNY